MGVEIERKFLVKKDQWASLAKGEGIFYKQGYILADPNKTIRVRIAGQKGYLTIKGVAVGASRLEYEYEIPLKDAQELLLNFCSSIITKVRYLITYGGKVWEVDEFLEENQGLLLAEIELISEAEPFEIPVWVDQEVTLDKRYFNSNLSVNPYKNWGDIG